MSTTDTHLVAVRLTTEQYNELCRHARAAIRSPTALATLLLGDAVAAEKTRYAIVDLEARNQVDRTDVDGA